MIDKQIKNNLNEDLINERTVQRMLPIFEIVTSILIKYTFFN